MTSARDYSLEKWVDLYPFVETPRMSTTQKLELEQRIKLMKALHGPPHMGKSLIPQTPRADDATIKLLKETALEDRVSHNDAPARAKIGESSAFHNCRHLAYMLCMMM
jgi:hypothetical protein